MSSLCDESGTRADYAFTHAHNKAMGHPITTEDAMIGAIAKANNLPLLTRNTKNFVHCQELAELEKTVVQEIILRSAELEERVADPNDWLIVGTFISFTLLNKCRFKTY